MKQVLVAYHSRSGHTRRVALALAQRLDADLDEIATRPARPGTWGLMRSVMESVLGLLPTLRHPARDPSRYRLVLIGTPVWVWNLPAPVRAWALAHPAGTARVAFFCTLGGSGAERVFDQLRTATGRTPCATLTVTEAQLSGELDPLLDAFVARLATTAPTTPREGAGQGALHPAARRAP